MGLIWVFKSVGTSVSSLALDPALLKAAVFIFLTLLFDFLQYLSGTSIWFLYYRCKEKKGTTATDEFLAPPQLNWVMWSLFYLKSATLVIAYAVYIIPFLIAKITA